jgi:hypothetical protein
MSRHIPARGDVTVSAVAELPGLFVPEFEAQRTVLRDQGFPEPDPIRFVGGQLYQAIVVRNASGPASRAVS